jgi:hypothetical protein
MPGADSNTGGKDKASVRSFLKIDGLPEQANYIESKYRCDKLI